MLKQRVVTALVLIAVLLPALFAPVAWPFALLSLALIAAAGWEWGRLNGAAAAGSLPLGVVLAVGCGAALWAGWAQRPPRAVWAAATLVWMLGGAWVLYGGPFAWARWPGPWRCAIGLALLWTAWLALVAARSIG